MNSIQWLLNKKIHITQQQSPTIHMLPDQGEQLEQSKV